jgi:TM2 domain-containing membrane protein YozV
MCELWLAYLLWLFGGCGALGLHRFYLRKFGTGILWLCSGGLCMVGSIYDLVNMRRLVDEANWRRGYELSNQAPVAYQVETPVSASKESLEHVILRLAKANCGAVTPGEIALEANVPMDKAKEALEKMAQKGHVEMRIRSDGVIVYAFPEFQSGAKTYEDI